jgi:hypothetical protein
MSHNSQRASTADIQTAEIRDEINNEKAARKESLQRKLLQEELNITGTKTKSVRMVTRTRPAKGNSLQASSSGRVTSRVKHEK